MSAINSLFSTPEQGRRLQELVPGLTSAFVWDGSGELLNYPHEKARFDSSSIFMPALTLQELFPLFKYSIYTDRAQVLVYGLMNGTLTAPELAAWVIERLEAQQ